MNIYEISHNGKIYLNKHDVSNYYIVVLFCNFLTMMTNSSRYIGKLLTNHLLLPGSATLNILSFDC